MIHPAAPKETPAGLKERTEKESGQEQKEAAERAYMLAVAWPEIEEDCVAMMNQPK